MLTMVVATMKAGTGQMLIMLLSAISVKVLAIMVGPAGLGLFSVLRNAQQVLSVIAALGGQNAIVQGIASLAIPERKRYIATTFWILVGGTAVVTASMLLFAAPLGRLFLGDQYGHILQWVIVPTIASVALIFFRGILNANMKIGTVVWVNIVVALGALLCVVPASTAFKAGYQEALILVLAGSFGLGAAFAIYLAHGRGYLEGFLAAVRSAPSWPAGKHFLRVALPTLVATFVGMGSVLLVRTLIVRWHGLPTAGQFDAAWSIGAMYLTLFLSSLQLYLLPVLSEREAGTEFRNLVRSTLHLSVIAVVPLVTALIVLKPLAIRVLYSGEFIPALEVLRWTLLGDLFRVGGWVLATALVARADMGAYLARELAWSAVFVALAFMLLPSGVSGAGLAYVVAYLVYLGLLLWRVWYRHAVTINMVTVAEWAGGATIVLAASVLTWSDISVVWLKLGLMPIALAYSWWIMTRDERRSVRSALVRLAKRFRLVAPSES